MTKDQRDLNAELHEGLDALAERRTSNPLDELREHGWSLAAWAADEIERLRALVVDQRVQGFTEGLRAADETKP